MAESTELSGSRNSSSLLMRHYGLIQVRIRPAEITLYWDVCNAERQALESVAGFLSTSPLVGEVELNYYHGGWARERSPSCAAANRRLLQIDSLRRQPPVSAVTVTQQRIESGIAASPVLAQGLELWQAMTRAGDGGLGHLLTILPQLVIFRWEAELGGPVIWHVGSSALALRSLGQSWASSADGKTFASSVTDRRFAASVCDAFPTVISRQEPRLDRVTGPLHRERGDPIFVSYRRLLLPVPLGEKRLIISLCETQVPIPSVAP